ncbi:yellowish-green 1-like protein [Hypoxylon trugodes]|uniref:yellowish-green 1-like protein n=1 Tax=Hypoxylon trugodes TaxID=326681 RepID=UPI0021990901|nr:yellowish-green 1-like protein [Hypoxylon trugodes]KAI1386923.1 yellowish-green 1-like protein [Hypoxylon trugodes]
MAAPGNKYFIQDKLSQRAPHHESFAKLWETQWKPACEKGLYPFMFSSIADFQPIVDDISAKGLKRPYDWDQYAECFFPKGEELVARAKQAEDEGNKEKAYELYMCVATSLTRRASAIYRIGRFPMPRSPKQWTAWERSKSAALKGLGLHKYPMVGVSIPHVHAANGDGPELQVFYHLPASASASNKVPLIVVFTGLDGYRTELAVWKNGWASLGCAMVIIEIPGTGDNPGVPSDPESADRVWSSLFDWVAQQEGIDQNRIANWGFSTGGYCSIRLAHTHPDKVKGAVCLGGGAHHMFDKEWLEAANYLEYPFDLPYTLSRRHGYAENELDKFYKEARDKFSLISTGIVDRPSTRLLLINGTDDEIFPIDDYILCLQRGGPKEARFVKGAKHMGEPESVSVILQWIFKILDLPGDVGQFMSNLAFDPKY